MNKLIFGIVSILVVACSSPRPYDPNAVCDNGWGYCIDATYMMQCHNGEMQKGYCMNGGHCENDPLLTVQARCFAPGIHWYSPK